MTATIYDDTACALGEGPLWHPERQALYWFDIIRYRLHTREGEETRTWEFGEHVSAAGWVDQDSLLIASETKLFLFNLTTGTSETVVGLEEDQANTRSNDGRADPHGGFWIGTMGKAAEPGLGAIYRYYRGEVRQIYPGVSVPNSIAFAPDGTTAYFADSRKKIIWRQRLSDAKGWPDGDPEIFLDLTAEGLTPDGSVVGADGTLWNAHWGGGQVAAYAPDGTFLQAVDFGAEHTTCPAFGGPDLTTLYCTSARQGLSAESLAADPRHGMTFVAEGFGPGQAEHRVLL